MKKERAKSSSRNELFGGNMSESRPKEWLSLVTFDCLILQFMLPPNGIEQIVPNVTTMNHDVPFGTETVNKVLKVEDRNET